jgi:hypothetical protein
MLFNIYTSDIPIPVERSVLVLYADETAVICRSPSTEKNKTLAPELPRGPGSMGEIIENLN